MFLRQGFSGFVLRQILHFRYELMSLSSILALTVGYARCQWKGKWADETLRAFASRSLLTNKSIQRATARSQGIKLYGDGERAAINLALERELLLLIDDWRPYEAARSAGVSVLNSAVYIVGLYQQHRIQFAKAVEAIAKRGTLTPGWIESALKVIANIRKEEANL